MRPRTPPDDSKASGSGLTRCKSGAAVAVVRRLPAPSLRLQSGKPLVRSVWGGSQGCVTVCRLPVMRMRKLMPPVATVGVVAMSDRAGEMTNSGERTTLSLDFALSSSGNRLETRSHRFGSRAHSSRGTRRDRTAGTHRCCPSGIRSSVADSIRCVIRTAS